MRALLTGGAGFIGSHLADRLVERGDDVLVFDNFSTGRRENLHAAASEAPVMEADIRDREAVETAIRSHEPEIIFHLAAQMDVRKSIADPLYDSAVNIGGTINLLEASRGLGSRFVLASSGGGIYGEGTGRALPFTEKDEAFPDSPYGQSKLASEGYCALFARVYELPTIALRLGNVYGPRQDPRGEAGVIAIFCGRFGSGVASAVYGDGRQTRDYVYVDDVVDAVIAAGACDQTGAFNVGTGRETSVLELIEALQAAFGRRDLAPEHAPPRTGEVLRTALDSTLAAATLGWEPATGIEQGLGETVAWFEHASASGQSGVSEARPGSG